MLARKSHTAPLAPPRLHGPKQPQQQQRRAEVEQLPAAVLLGQLHFVEGAEGDLLAAHGDEAGFVEQVVGGVEELLGKQLTE